ncbi:unnamed protein product [Discula destructiva]
MPVLGMIGPSALGNVLSSPGSLITIVSLGFVGYVLSVVLYDVFFHPLRAYPGPWLWRFSRIPYIMALTSGRLPHTVLAFHERYGPVVRLAPNEVVYVDSRAWKDIYGHRGAGEAEMPKADAFYRTTRVKTANNIISARTREEHGALRRPLAHGFSERSMREQQPLIKGYIDLLMQRLRERGDEGRKSLDMTEWYNYTTFDVIGDLAFGESFGCLATGEYHPWVRMIFQSVKLGAFMHAANYAPMLALLVVAMVPKGLMEKRKEHLRLTQEKLMKRMELGGERPDLIEGLLLKKNELNLSLDELQANCSTLIIAGSETTASLLSGITYLLGTHPHALAKLAKEVRTSFKTEDDIDLISVGKLNYMLACLDEALRLYPPAPLGLPRTVPKGGANIAGRYVPEDTQVSLFHYAVYHYEGHFTEPEEYHPERWLGDPRFANDNREAFQPFVVGPRNCLGRNLAYAEMRLILARLLWNFDIELADVNEKWIAKQKIYNIWEKVPLRVHLTPRSKY